MTATGGGPAPTLTSTACPQCGHTVPVDPRFPTWCDQCGWGLVAQDAGGHRRLVDGLYARAGVLLSKQLYEKLRQHPQQAGFSAARLGAYAIAAVVDVLTFACLLGGLLLIVRTWFNLLQFLAGLFLIFLAWILRPRPGQPPKGVAERTKLRAWYRLVDTVAHAVGASPIDEIVITPDFNASFSQRGLRRRTSTLRLGAPLLHVLTTEQRVALIGHEMAHGANGDPRRGVIVGSAFRALETWYRVLYPGYLEDAPGVRSGSAPGLAVIANLLMAAAAMVPKAVAYVLVHLVWRDSQRAEYLADRLAVRAAGTEAMLGLLDILHFGRAVDSALTRVSIGREAVDLFSALDDAVGSIPERELERIRRVERMEGSRLDSSHPPTAFRIDLITSDPVREPAVVVAPENAAKLDQELAAFEPAVRKTIVDNYRRRLYR